MIADLVAALVESSLKAMRLATPSGSSHHEAHDLHRSIFRLADDTGKVSNEQPNGTNEPRAAWSLRAPAPFVG